MEARVLNEKEAEWFFVDIVVCGWTTPELLAKDEVLRLASYLDLLMPIEVEL